MAKQFEPEKQGAEEGEEDFEKLLEQHLPKTRPGRLGEVIDATVAAIVDDSVLVSYGLKEETAIPLAEFQGAKGELSVRVGDSVKVVFTGWGDDGAELSHKAARAIQARAMLEEAAKRGKPVRGVVRRSVKGGLIVDLGAEAFLPGSQVDIFRVPDLEALVGQEIEAYITEYDAHKGRAVLSRRKLLEERKAESRTEFFAGIKSGDTLTGRIKDVLDFGVFVSFDGGEGLIPRSEWSYERSAHPGDNAKPGMEVTVKVLEVDAATGKLTLSRKRLNEDPWTRVKERYPVGTTVTGKVVKIEPFGAFVSLEEGLTGLLHSKDLSWESERKDASKSFMIGDAVNCQVLEIDEANRRLSLSLKHLSRDPWMDLEAAFPIGSRHKVTVTRIKDFGAFVRLNEFAEGLLHIGDLSWEKRVKHPSEMLKEGDEIEVVVLKLDRDQRRIGVGLKQVEHSPFLDFVKAHKVGDVITAKVCRLMPFGAFMDLGRGLEGLVHISELSEQRVDTVERATKLGEEFAVKVLSIDANKEKIALSRKAAIRQEEQDNIKSWQREEKKKDEGFSPFANALKNAQENKKKKLGLHQRW